MRVKHRLSRFYFTLYLCLLIGLSVLVAYVLFRKRVAYTRMGFREAVISLKEKDGSSSDYFVHLSNNQTFLFTVPHRAIQAGDSLIKVENESFFTLKHAGGKVKLIIGVDGKVIDRKH